MVGATRTRVRRIAYLVIGLGTLINGGCLLIAAGAAAGGAAAGYVYFKGRLSHDYPTNLPDALAAMHKALDELRFPILEESPTPGTVFIATKTTDGSKIRIHLELIHSRIPAEGPITRITVRVLPLGDEVVSARILDQTMFHLTPPPINALPSSPPPGPIQPTAAAVPPETKQPPLAPVPYGGVKK